MTTADKRKKKLIDRINFRADNLFSDAPEEDIELIDLLEKQMALPRDQNGRWKKLNV